MLKSRTFRIVKISEQSSRGDQNIAGGQTVSYDGKEVTVKL